MFDKITSLANKIKFLTDNSDSFYSVYDETFFLHLNDLTVDEAELFNAVRFLVGINDKTAIYQNFSKGCVLDE